MLRHSPRPSRRHHATRFALALVSAIGIFIPGSWAASDIDVPYIGEPADRALSPMQETQLGNEVMRQLLSGGYVLEDLELASYMRTLGKSLLQHTNEQDIDFHFFVVKDAGINAFALPGGFIGMNAGLIMASETESELAGVMSHEIAHVTQRHIARSMDRSSGWDIATTALLLAALVAGARDPEAAQAALTLGMSAAIQQQINFTRANELEADRLGIRTLAAAGFDPTGMASFFHRLSQKSQLYGEGVPELLRTHPMSSNRMAEAASRAASMPAGPANLNSEYTLMKTRARVLMTELDGDALAWFNASTKNGSSTADRYGLALSLARNRAFDDAAKLLQTLIDEDPEQRHYRMAYADLLIQRGQADAAVKLLQKTREQHADYRPLTLKLASALIRAGKPADARQLLLESPLPDIHDAETHRLLAMAARDMNEQAEAYYQFAGYERSRGDFVAAIRQLDNGLQLDALEPHDRQRLQGRLEQYLAEAPESERRRARTEAQQRR